MRKSREQIADHWLSWSLIAVLGAQAAYALVPGRGGIAVAAVVLFGAACVALIARLRTVRDAADASGEALTARTAELQTLHTIGREIVTSLRPERVFRILERHCRKVLDYDGFLLVLVEDNDDRPHAALRKRGQGRTEVTSTMPVQELVRWVAEERRARRVDDVTRLPRTSPLRAPWLDSATRSLIVAPLLVNDTLVGLMCVESDRVGAYDDHHMLVLSTAAQQTAIAVENARHYQRATVDSLTGLYVRDYFFSRLEEEDERARRYGGGFALLMLDLDGFKEINDRNGHLAGDQYLCEISATLRDQLRAADIASRFGGDEFCVLLPETGIAGARAIAERIREAVGKRIVGADGLALRTTVSIGLAAFPDHAGGDLRDLLRKADEALYRAKRNGRDRVVPFAA